MSETTQQTTRAQSLIDRLIESKLLELEQGSDRAQLAEGVSRVLSSPAGSRERASSLAEWLLGQPAVAELFASDEELAALLEQGGG